MIRTSNDFGNMVKSRRKALGWTQAELAARAGTGERFVLELEAGKPRCQLDKALLVARTLGMQLDDIATQSQLAVPSAIDDDDLAFLPTFGPGQR